MKTGHSKTNSEPRYNIRWQSAKVLTNCTENFKTLQPGSTYVERQVSPKTSLWLSVVHPKEPGWDLSLNTPLAGQVQSCSQVGSADATDLLSQEKVGIFHKAAV